jgi:hypothetical protein
VNQTQIQSTEQWESGFSLSDTDLEQIYNHFLETEKPQTVAELAGLVIRSRVREQAAEVRRIISGSTVYQPRRSYAVGEEVIFPALRLAKGQVTQVRPGYNPEYGDFNVITVNLKGKPRDFVADYTPSHALNDSDGGVLTEQMAGDAEAIQAAHGATVAARIGASLAGRDDFVNIGEEWFVKSLMADVNIGHLHLTEAILDMTDGGPLTTAEILPQLELDPGVDAQVQAFSLNHHLLRDGRFDDVSPAGEARWFLRRMEPDAVQTTPDRLVYQPIAYDRSLLSPQQIALEQELDDEWSDLPPAAPSDTVVLALSYPHRWAGTLPINARTRALFDAGRSPRRRVVFIDDETNESIAGWVVAEGRYVHGLSNWYKDNAIPVGGFLHLRPGPEPGTILLGYDRRRAQREWVRLGAVKDNKLQFELMRRAIPCGYDDLLIVGTDVVAAVDAHAKRATSLKLSVGALLSEVFPSLAGLTPQNSVHAKTLYSAINMLRRVPPGPIFAELMRNPAFKGVGDHYWQQE